MVIIRIPHVTAYRLVASAWNCRRDSAIKVASEGGDENVVLLCDCLDNFDQ